MRTVILRISLRASCALLVSLSCCAAIVCASADNATPACRTPLRPCDTVWIVSTRAFPCGDPRLHVNQLTYHVRDEHGLWQKADLSALLATDDPSVTTVFWIHGNRYVPWEANSEGLGTYRAITKCVTCDTPVRFVIFSWPSQQIDGGPIEDVRVKAARSNPNGYYLAWLLDQFQADVPISLIGHSYGARITMGGLHLLGGGTLCGWRLDERAHPDRQPMRVSLVAAAMDNHWLIPGHRLGNSLSQVEHLTNIYNSCDPAVKRYHRLYSKRSDAEAMGYTGIAGLNRLGGDRAKIQQLDACCYVGKVHSWKYYLASGPIMARISADSLPPVTQLVKE